MLEDFKNIKSPNDLYQAIESEISAQNAWNYLPDFPLRDSSQHEAQQAAIRIREENLFLDLPPVPTGGNMLDLQNWCIDAQQIMDKAKKDGGQSKFEGKEQPEMARYKNEGYPCWNIALQSFRYALGENRELAKATQEDIYEWLSNPENKDSEKHPYHGMKMPKLKSWQSYIRSACNRAGTDIEKIREEAKKNWLYRDHQNNSNKYRHMPKPQKTKQRPNKS